MCDKRLISHLSSFTFLANSAVVKGALPMSDLPQRVQSWAGVYCVSETSQKCCFAGRTFSEGKPILFAADKTAEGAKVFVYSDDVMLGAFFLPMIKGAVKA